MAKMKIKSDGQIHMNHTELKKLLHRIRAKTKMDMTEIVYRIVSKHADEFTQSNEFHYPKYV